MKEGIVPKAACTDREEIEVCNAWWQGLNENQQDKELEGCLEEQKGGIQLYKKYEETARKECRAVFEVDEFIAFSEKHGEEFEQADVVEECVLEF